MTKHLTTLALAGTLGVFLLAGDAQACHMRKCNRSCAGAVACAPAPVACQPAPTCAPRQKKCGGGLFAKCGGGMLAGCFKKKSCGPAPAPCTTVAYNYAPTYTYAAPVTSGPYYGTPQASAQYPTTGTPQVPAKSMGTPQR
jgi:hypothetical protein